MSGLKNSSNGLKKSSKMLARPAPDQTARLLPSALFGWDLVVFLSVILVHLCILPAVVYLNKHFPNFSRGRPAIIGQSREVFSRDGARLGLRQPVEQLLEEEVIVF